MISIREIKKEKSRIDILSVSRDMFLDKGYDEVSMEEIAKKAFVGIGTLYNYYKNKGDIFIAVLQNELEDNQNLETELSLSTYDDVLSYIIDYIEKYLKKFEWAFSKKIMNGFMKAMVSLGTKNNKLFKAMTKLDFIFIDDLEKHLVKLQEVGMLRGNCRQMAELTYAAIMYEFFILLYFDFQTIDEVKENIKSKLTVIYQ